MHRPAELSHGRIGVTAFLAAALGLQTSHAQTTLTFTAQRDGYPIALDSILVLNLDQGGDTMLYAPDTVLVLDLSTGLSGGLTDGLPVDIRPPYPNPFDGSTRFQVGSLEPGQLVVSIYDLTGRVVASTERSVASGTHAFTYQGGGPGMLLIVAEINGRRSVERMLSMSVQGSTPSLLYGGSAGMNEQGRPKNAGPFYWSQGDSLKYVGYVTHAPVPLGLDSLVQGSVPVVSSLVPFTFITQVDILEEADLAILDALQETVLLPEDILIRDGLTAFDILQALDPDFPGMTGGGQERQDLTTQEQQDLLFARMAYFGWFLIDDAQHT